MVTTFDVFAVVVGQLKLFIDHTKRNTSLREIKANKTHMAILSNMLLTNPELFIEGDKPINIEHMISNSAKSSNDKIPCTMAIVDGLALPFVDRTFDSMTVLVDNAPTPEHTVGCFVAIPKKLLSNDSDDDFNDTLAIILKLFIDILSLDKMLKYVPNEALFKNIGRKYIPSYDITLLMSACACVSIILKSIYGFNENYAEYILDPYKDIMDELVYNRILKTIDTYGVKIGVLRDAIYDGSFMGSAFG